MSVLGLWIWVSLVSCTIGYVIIQPPAQYNDHQSQPNELQWQPLEYKTYDNQHEYHDYQLHDYKPYDYQRYDYQLHDYKPPEYQPSEYQPIFYQPYEHQPYGYKAYEYQHSDYNPYKYYSHQPYDYQPSYYSNYYSYYSNTLKYPEPHKPYPKTHKSDLSYDEGQKFLQVYRLIRVIVVFRTPPKYHKKITLLDKLVELLTKKSLQDQLVELVCHVDGYKEVAALERGPEGTKMDTFVDDDTRLLNAIQQALNALDLDEYDHGCCQEHEELCAELRKLRDQANALFLIKKEKVLEIKAMVKQALDTDILEDLDEGLESRLLELDYLDIEMPVITPYEEDQKLYSPPFYGNHQTSSPVEVDFVEMASALKLQLKQHLDAQVPEVQKKSQEGIVQVLPIEKAPASIMTTIATPQIPPITTEKAKESLGSVIEVVNPLPVHQAVEMSKPVAVIEPVAVTEGSNRLKEPNLWVHKDAVVQNLINITQRFQHFTSTDRSGLIWPHSVPLWLVKNPEPQEIVNKDVSENETEKAEQTAVNEAKLQLVSEGVDDSLANYDAFADLIEHEAESFTPEVVVVDEPTELHHHQQLEHNLTKASANEEAVSPPYGYEAPPQGVPSEAPEKQSTISTALVEKVQHSKNDESAADLKLNTGELIVTKARLGTEEETGKPSNSTVTTASSIIAANSQNTAGGVGQSWLGSLFGKGYLLPVGQTIDEVTEPAKLVESVVKQANKIVESVVVTHENALANISTLPSLQTPESSDKNPSSVSAVFNSVTSWLRKSPDQNLQNEGTVVEETGGKARALPDDGTELQLVNREADGSESLDSLAKLTDHSETKAKSKPVQIDEEKGVHQPTEQRSLGAPNDDATSSNSPSIAELLESRALVESEEIEIPLPTSAVAESDVQGFVGKEAMETDIHKELDAVVKGRDLEELDISVPTITDNESMQKFIEFPSGLVLGESKSAAELNSKQNKVTKAQQIRENDQEEDTTTMETSSKPSITKKEVNLLPDIQAADISHPEAPVESVTEENSKLHASSFHDATSPRSQIVLEEYKDPILSESPEEQSSTNVEEVPMFRTEELELIAEEQMISEAPLAKEDDARERSLDEDTTASTTITASSQTVTEEASKTWLGSLFGKGSLLSGRQTIEEDTRSTDLTKNNEEDVDLASDSSFQTSENTKTSSVSAMIHSVTSWLRKSPDQQKLEDGGADDGDAVGGIARALPDESSDKLASLTEPNESTSESVAVDEPKKSQELIQFHKKHSSIESRDGDEHLPTTATLKSDGRAYAKAEFLKILSLLEDANGFTELKDHINDKDVDQLVDGLDNVETDFTRTEIISALQNLVAEKQFDSSERILEVLEHLKEGEGRIINDGYFDKTYGEEGRQLGGDAEDDSTLNQNETLKSQVNVNSGILAEVETSRIDMDVDDQQESHNSTENPRIERIVGIKSSQEGDELTEKLGNTTPQPFLADES